MAYGDRHFAVRPVGVHRLLKAPLLGIPIVRVRVLPAERIDEIRRS